ncbi:MAG: DUF4202 domain-containing protein [Proteobacteria bacterium]|nr:DUF4202 domain-containing protein [Pseudomonadota bacterium]
MAQQAYDKAVSLMDAANGEDPNIELADGREWPRELLYSHRMSQMLERFQSAADEVVKLAIRGQHIQRWKSPRNAYPMDRAGYHQWRTDLYKFHAVTAAGLMAEAGYDEQALERVRNAIGKRKIKVNPDTQLLEDVASLVFIEFYMLAFAEKHPEYDEAKWINIIQKTWKKMSSDAHAFALSGDLRLPESLVPLIQKSVAD